MTSRQAGPAQLMMRWRRPDGAAAAMARLQKPFTAESLATTVRHVLDRGSAPGSG